MYNDIFDWQLPIVPDEDEAELEKDFVKDLEEDPPDCGVDGDCEGPCNCSDCGQI